MNATPEPAPEIIMDARGIYWRRYPTYLSMVPVSDDNLPVPEPYIVYRPVAPCGVETPEAAVEAMAQAIDDWQDETHWYGESLPSFAIAQHLSRGLVAQGWTPPGGPE